MVITEKFVRLFLLSIYCKKMGGPVVCYQNKYIIKSINSMDSIQARYEATIQTIVKTMRLLYALCNLTFQAFCNL